MISPIPHLHMHINASKHNIKQYIVEYIRENGPISIEYFMHIISTHYYANNKAIGVDADFITAPEISQMFGEIIAIFLINHFLNKIEQTNHKSQITLVELGGGKGTLMSDILRCSKSYPDFYNSISNILMLEKSEHMQEAQSHNINNISDHKIPINHHTEINNLISHITEIRKAHHSQYTFFIANEFFDALPIRQYSYSARDKSLYEVRVHYSNEQDLHLGISTSHKIAIKTDQLKNGDILEHHHTTNVINKSISNTMRSRDCAIIIDYGYTKPPYLSSLQAIYKHNKVSNIFEHLGDADLSSLINFQQLKQIYDAKHHTTITTQREFLLQNGIMQRAQKLMSVTDKPHTIARQLNRLIDNEEMGELFKVLLVT